MLSEPAFCPFAPRCPNRIAVCTEQLPRLARLDTGQQAACFNPVEADAWQRYKLEGVA
jgi:peptide/nickel transport system ATP-binding protein